MKLKVNEVASQLGETPNVIRNWIRDFKQHIPIEKADNGYNFYPPEAVAVLLSIQKMARIQGYSTRQIEHYLSGGELAAAVEVAAESEPIMAVSPSAEVAELKEMVQLLLNQQQEQQLQQQEFNKALLAQLDKRDKQLTDFIVERRLEQKQLQQEEIKPWWKRIFLG